LLMDTHLIIMSQAPLSIRFRFDEKRFDVDGAHNIAREIVKSRIEKTMVKDGKERLTQPQRIAMKRIKNHRISNNSVLSDSQHNWYILQPFRSKNIL
jgi:hypothetical protein